MFCSQSWWVVLEEFTTGGEIFGVRLFGWGEAARRDLATTALGEANPPEPLRLRRCACRKSDGFAFGHTCYVYGPRAEFFLSEKGKRVKVKRVLLTWRGESLSC